MGTKRLSQLLAERPAPRSRQGRRPPTGGHIIQQVDQAPSTQPTERDLNPRFRGINPTLYQLPAQVSSLVESGVAVLAGHAKDGVWLKIGETRSRDCWGGDEQPGTQIRRCTDPAREGRKGWPVGKDPKPRS